MCRSRDLIGNCIGAERGDYTWNGKRFCDLHVDSIRSLLVSLNAIKRTQLLTEHNNGLCSFCHSCHLKLSPVCYLPHFSHCSIALGQCRM